MVAEMAWTSGKVLVVYYSLSGNTARVAHDIARIASADVESLQDRKHGIGFFGYVKAALDALRGKAATLGALTHDPGKYSLVVIGTPVWVGRMTPAIRAYLERFAADLPHVAFFVTSGNTDAGKVVPSMEQVLGHRAHAYTGFSARELGNPRPYETKLAAFLEAVHRAPIPQPHVPGAACCP